MIFVIFAFIIALIIHGHQTEATYRLDFLWKLQATGIYTHKLAADFVYISESNESCEKHSTQR